MKTDTAITTDLRLGDWRDVLADVRVDVLIADPPYGTRTHVGHDHASRDARISDNSKRSALGYAAWSPADVREFVASWAPRVRGWMCVMSCSQLVPAYAEAFAHHDRVTFAPVPCIIRGMTVRMAGDGPSNWAIYLNVARPRTREYARWGTLPGHYDSPPRPRGKGKGAGVTGGKPLGLMRQIVRHYSRPGDLVCDPCAGHGTTLDAARFEGRPSLGAEVDPETCDEALRRLHGQPQRRDGQPELFG